MVLIFFLIVVTMLHILFLWDRNYKTSLYDRRDYILLWIIVIWMTSLRYLTTYRIAIITTICLLILLIPCIIWLNKSKNSQIDVCYGNKVLDIIISIFQSLAIIWMMVLLWLNYEKSPWMTAICELWIRWLCFVMSNQEWKQEDCLQLTWKIMNIICLICIIPAYYLFILSMRRVKIYWLILPIFLIIWYIKNKD